MTKKKTTGKVLPTKIAPPKTVRLTKTQRELYLTKRNSHRDGMKIIIDEYSKLSEENLGKTAETFAEELKIDIINEAWRWDANTLQFIKEEEKKGLPKRAV